MQVVSGPIGKEQTIELAGVAVDAVAFAELALRQAPADIGAQRIDRAMGEIDQIGDAENQRQPDREQRVDIADDEAVDRIIVE